MTDADTEWVRDISSPTEKYEFVWKRKNVTLTRHGAMTRLDRTVRTLRKYIHDAFFGMWREEQDGINMVCAILRWQWSDSSMWHTFFLRVGTRAPCTGAMGDASNEAEGLSERTEELQESQSLFQNQKLLERLPLEGHDYGGIQIHKIRAMQRKTTLASTRGTSALHFLRVNTGECSVQCLGGWSSSM